MSAFITGSGKTMAFGIPMIHTILEWRNSSEKPVDDDTKAATQVESLYLPAVEESTQEETEEAAESTVEGDDEEDTIADEEGGDSITEQDQSDTDERDSEDDDERLGCVQVIENPEFDFDQAAEGEGQPAGSRGQPLLGLVLTPTRELAVQVKHHIDAVAKFTGKSLKIYE